MKFFILAILPALALATTGLHQCAEWPATVDIAGCPSTPCTAKVGSTVKGTTTFTAKKTIKEPTLEVRVANGTLIVPIDELDVCKLLASGQSCPLKSGVKYSVTTSIKVLKIIPAGPNDVRFSILDDDFNAVVCVQGKITLTE